MPVFGTVGTVPIVPTMIINALSQPKSLKHFKMGVIWYYANPDFLIFYSKMTPCIGIYWTIPGISSGEPWEIPGISLGEVWGRGMEGVNGE